MNPQELLEQYLSEKHMMQLATSVDGQPWNCTVYFVHDDDNNLYWASLATRRHSQEIKHNSKVAVAIPVQHVKGEPVIGVQMEGVAEELPASPDNKAFVANYAAKFNRDSQWVEDFAAGNTDHKLYKFTPSAIYLFDEVNFPGGQRRQVL